MKQRTKWKYWFTFPRCKAFGKNQTYKKREKHLASRKTQYISKQQCIMHSSIKPCLHRTISVLYPALEGERLQHTCYRTLNIHLEPLFPKAIFRKTLCIVCLYLILYTDKHHKKKRKASSFFPFQLYLIRGPSQDHKENNSCSSFNNLPQVAHRCTQAHSLFWKEENNNWFPESVMSCFGVGLAFFVPSHKVMQKITTIPDVSCNGFAQDGTADRMNALSYTPVPEFTIFFYRGSSKSWNFKP